MKINTLIVFREEFDGQGMLFNPEDGQVFGLNPTGAALWKLLEKQIAPENLFSELGKLCKDPLPENAHEEIAKFLDQLEKKGFLLQ